MATKYLALLTNIGAAKLAKATALGTKVEITQLAVGDGNGVLPTPNPAQTALVHERRRAPLNMLTVDPANVSQIIAEQVIPEDVGGWWIREIGLFDKDGDMVAIANCAETYKPQLQEGSGRVQVIRVILIVSSTEAVTLKIDPAVVLATRQYVDSQLRAHEQSRNHPDASTTEKGFVQLSSSVTSDSESQAATPKAVKIAMDNANARLAKERNLSDLPNPALARQNLQLGDSSTKNTGTTANTVAAGDDARITGAMQKSQNGADIQDVAKFLQNLGLSDVMKTGDFGLGVKNETKPGGMAALGVTQFDYFEPADNIGPLPGSWCGGLSYAMGDDIGFQLAGSGQLQPNENPRLFFRSKFADKTFTQWGEIYHTLNKPTASDLGITLGTAASRDVGTGANQIPDMSSFTSGGNADARWRKLPDGTIEQFGIVNGMTTNAVTVAYPIAFPSELTSFEVAATGDLLASSYNTINIAATPAQGNNLTHFSATGYNTFTDGRTALNNVMFYWRAIGR